MSRVDQKLLLMQVHLCQLLSVLYSTLHARISICAQQGRVLHQTHLPPHYDGGLAALVEPLCWVPHALNCWQWLKAGLPLLPTSECGNSESGTHKAYLAGKVMMGFCYFCGFLFLKRNSVVSLVFSDFLCPACCTSLLLFPHFQKHNFVPYCFKHSPFLPFFHLFLLSLQLIYPSASQSCISCLCRLCPLLCPTQHVLTPDPINTPLASPQHISSAPSAFLSSHQKCKISQQALSIALGL